MIVAATVGVVIVGASVAWNDQLLGGPQPPQASTLLLTALLFLIAMPLVLGALAGFLIRRNGKWPEIFLMAALGAACMAIAIGTQWVDDPRVCWPAPGPGCDLAVVIGTAVVSGVFYWPFLLGAALGKGSVAALRARAARRGSRQENS